MKNKLLLPGLALLLTCSIFQQLRAQNSIFIKLNNGTQNSVVLSSLNKITFSSANMFLNLNNATTNSFAISDINKITFGLSAGINDVENESKLSVFPNPASDFIKIKNLPAEESMITVYRIDGAIVMQRSLSFASPSIDISGLSTGLYLIRIGNQTLKFTKR